LAFSRHATIRSSITTYKRRSQSMPGKLNFGCGEKKEGTTLRHICSTEWGNERCTARKRRTPIKLWKAYKCDRRLRTTKNVIFM
jgi:hypothetical protein